MKCSQTRNECSSIFARRFHVQFIWMESISCHTATNRILSSLVRWRRNVEEFIEGPIQECTVWNFARQRQLRLVTHEQRSGVSDSQEINIKKNCRKWEQSGPRSVAFLWFHNVRSAMATLLRLCSSKAQCTYWYAFDACFMYRLEYNCRYKCSYRWNSKGPVKMETFPIIYI